jgi:hypothetical protein
LTWSEPGNAELLHRFCGASTIGEELGRDDQRLVPRERESTVILASVLALDLAIDAQHDR